MTPSPSTNQEEGTVGVAGVEELLNTNNAINMNNMKSSTEEIILGDDGDDDDVKEEKKMDTPTPSLTNLSSHDGDDATTDDAAATAVYAPAMTIDSEPSPPIQNVVNHAATQANENNEETKHQYHVHFSTFTSPSSPPPRRTNSYNNPKSFHRTKSWTDHDRAPEPFSSPVVGKKLACNANNNNKKIVAMGGGTKKYGYGTLLRSNSSTTRGGGGTPKYGYGTLLRRSNSTASSAAAGMPLRNEQNNIHRQQRKPSFTISDFPVLSPVKPSTNLKQKQPTAVVRQTSWSAVVGGGSNKEAIESSSSNVADSSDEIAGIPPLPLVEGSNSALLFDADVKEVVSEEEEDEIVKQQESSSPIQSSRTYWQQKQQRRRAHSFHHYSTPTVTMLNESSTTVIPPITYHPFSTFTTQSNSALQNDIGTLLARSNRVLEAMERYKTCIDLSSKVVLLNSLDAEQQQPPFGGESNNNEKSCPNRVTEAEGLAWFRQKLLRGDIMSPPPPPQQQAVATESGGANSGETVRSTIEDGSSFYPSSSVTEDASSPNLQNKPAPFQPAGFGGLCALQSPRQRLRSSSFSVADLMTPIVPPTSAPSCPKHLALPLIDDGNPTDNISGGLKKSKATTKSPLKARNKFVRTSSAPINATAAPQYHAKPHTPQLLSGTLSRTYSGHHQQMPPLQHHQMSQGMDDIVHDIHVHQKLDCPDNEIYSCNGLTPLGLEYICDPLPVLCSSLRTLLVSSMSTSLSKEGAASRRKRVGTVILESAALIASRINLASLQYRLAGGGVSERLQDVLRVLELALDDCQSALERIDKLFIDESKDRLRQAKTIFNLLKAVIHSNIGTVKYRLKKVRDSFASFELAKSTLAEAEDNEDWSSNQLDENLDYPSEEDGDHHDHNQQSQDDDRFPPHSYLLLVVRLNLSRVSLLLSKLDDAESLCNLISEDNKPHRRQSSQRSLLHSSQYQQGSSPSFRRSNSSCFATLSALQTASAAYEHDIDRRTKWLCSVSEHYITGLIHEARGETSNYKEAWHHYNRLLSLARTKLDHRHPYVCALLERRGAVLFEQRKLQCSMLSYLACLRILEHQQTCTKSNVFNMGDLSRVLYAVARVLHDKEEYHDALHMYQRALVCQRKLASEAGRPASLDVITTLCNISRVHHLSGEIDEALRTNQEVLELATILVGGKLEHPFLIHRLKVEGNILVEAGRLNDAMRTFVEAARRCSEDGRDRMMTALVGGGSSGGSGSSSQEDADAGDSSVLSIRSAAALAQINFFHPAAASA